MPLIKQGEVVHDIWTVLADDAPLDPAKPSVVSLQRWLKDHNALLASGARLGIRLKSGESPAQIADQLDKLDLVQLEFPAFTNGRAFSYARLLRDRFGYKGEVRAVGQVLRDQFMFLDRCGFDAVEVARPEDAAAWAAELAEMKYVYQPASDRRPWVNALRQGGKVAG